MNYHVRVWYFYCTPLISHPRKLESLINIVARSGNLFVYKNFNLKLPEIVWILALEFFSCDKHARNYVNYQKLWWLIINEWKVKLLWRHSNFLCNGRESRIGFNYLKNFSCISCTITNISYHSLMSCNTEPDQGNDLNKYSIHWKLSESVYFGIQTCLVFWSINATTTQMNPQNLKQQKFPLSAINEPL